MLTQKHLDELLKSCIDPDIIALNSKSIDGSDIYEYLCYSSKLERLNAGRLASKWLDRYSHCEAGGWWCSGLDPLDNWQPMLWGQFKPDTPRVDSSGKKVKYEPPPQTPTRAYFLRVTFAIGLRIAQKSGQEGEYKARIRQAYTETKPAKTRRLAKLSKKSSRSWISSRTLCHIYSLRHLFSRSGKLVFQSISILREREATPPAEWLSTTEDKGFWAWVLDNQVPVIITEGAKKAGCLLAEGHAAIALPGVTGAVRVPKDDQGNKTGESYLIPEIKILAIPGQEVYICFDHDEKPTTAQNVSREISKLGRLLEAEGCDVKVISLPGPEKGVDDFIQAQGSEAFWKLYESASPLSTWQTNPFRQLTYKPNVVISTKYLGKVDVPDDAKLVAFKAPKGSGKTEVIVLLCEEAYKNEQPVIVLTYREQLGRELARRFKLPYKTELGETPEGMLYGFALCVDSCHPKSEVTFHGGSWADALVVIDECESVVWHTLDSSTCTKNRLPILHELKALFTGALSSETKGRIVLADADLSDLTIGFVKGMAVLPHLKPYVIRSDYKPKGSEVLSYQTPVDLYYTFKAKAKGGKHIIFTGAQKVTSKWSSQNLEKLFSKEFPKARILRIDKETTADPNSPAFGCIDHLNEVLPQWDIVIASPVIESGVSIDLHNHFAGIWCFASGLTPTDNVRQTLARVRDTGVPRHISLPERGLHTSFVGNGSTFPTTLRNGELKKSKANYDFLLEAGVTVDADGSLNANVIALDTWLKMASRNNAGFHNYRGTILADLEAEGHSVTQLDSQLDPESGKALSESVTKSREELEEDEAKKVVAADPPWSEAEYRKLKSQKTKTSEQRRSLVNYEIQQRYLAPPTAETILKDWDGWHPHLRLHYYLTVGNQYLSERDGKRFSDISQSGRSWIPDTNRILLSNKIKALKALEIERLFVPGVNWTQDSPEIQEIVEKALACAKDIKLFLGVTVTKKNKPMAIVQEILNQALGFRLEEPPEGEPQVIEKGVNSKGKRQRLEIYRFVYPDDDRREIFDRWLLRDAEAAERKAEQKWCSKNVLTSDTEMAEQNPIDLYTDFAPPSPRILQTPQEKEISPPNKRAGEGWVVGQRVKTWFGIGHCWREGLIQSVEVNTSGCFKAVVKLANGATQYIWHESDLEGVPTSPEETEETPPLNKGDKSELERLPTAPPVQEGALNVGTKVTCWGWGAARYVVESFVDDVIVEITNVAMGAKFTEIRSMLTPVLEDVP